MRINWILTSIISGGISGFLTYYLFGNFKIALLISVIVLVIVLLHNPITRYIRAFYIVSFPLISSIFFTVEVESKNLKFKGGLKDQDWVSIIVLGTISLACLILDYLEKNGKLKNTIFSVKQNVVKKVIGDNNQINQTND